MSLDGPLTALGRLLTEQDWKVDGRVDETADVEKKERTLALTLSRRREKGY